MTSNAYLEGYLAYQADRNYDTNPYSFIETREEWEAFYDGWDDAYLQHNRNG